MAKKAVQKRISVPKTGQGKRPSNNVPASRAVKATSAPAKYTSIADFINAPVNGVTVTSNTADSDIAPFDFNQKDAVQSMQSIYADVEPVQYVKGQKYASDKTPVTPTVAPCSPAKDTANKVTKKKSTATETTDDVGIIISPDTSSEVAEYAALSEDDKQFIHDSARKISPEEIAKAIGKNNRVVYRYMQTRGLLSEDDKADWRVRQAQINELRAQAFYPALQKSYDNEELTYFEDEWVRVISQFKENITASERITLKQAIEISIKMQRLSIREQELRQQIQKTKAELAEIDIVIAASDEDDDNVRILKAQQVQLLGTIAAYENGTQLSDKQWRDFSDTHTKLMTSLSATRDRRVDKGDIADANSWNKILQAVTDNPIIKRQMSSAAWCAFLAEERVRAKLARTITYADGDIMPPILTTDTVQGRNNTLGDLVDAAYAPKADGKQK